MKVFSWLAMLGAALALAPPESRRTLVVVDDTNPSVSLASVSEPLKARGFDVTEVSVRTAPELLEFGLRAYDNLVIVPGTTKALGKNLTAPKLVEFMELGGNVVCLTTPKYSPVALRDLGSQLGLTISSRGVKVVDHFGDSLKFPHADTILDAAGLKIEPSNEDGESDTAVAFLTGTNKLALPLAAAPDRAYAYNGANEDDEDVLTSQPFATGDGALVVAGFQGMNGARFAWTGSSQFLSGNPAEQLLSWAFHERNVLRIASTSHESVEQGSTHLHYRVGEQLKYCVALEQWHSEVGAWKPFTPSDAQFEFKMLDPYYRLFLEPSEQDDNKLCSIFKAPDQYGMFTFAFDYLRAGFTYLESSEIVTMRHIANDEWPRSWTITNAWVYLSGLVVTIAAFLLFIPVFLSAGDEPAKYAAAAATTAAGAAPAKNESSAASSTKTASSAAATKSTAAKKRSAKKL